MGRPPPRLASQLGKPYHDQIFRSHIEGLLLYFNLPKEPVANEYKRYNTKQKDTYISLMGQNVPAGRAADYPELSRRRTSGEYRRACRRLLDAGFENGFFQEESAAAPDYVPEFDGSGLPSPEEQA